MWDIDVTHLQLLLLHKKILIPEDTKTNDLKQDRGFLVLYLQTHFNEISSSNLFCSQFFAEDVKQEDFTAAIQMLKMDIAENGDGH